MGMTPSTKNLLDSNASPRSSTDRPRLLIAASGTGGHVFPALAVAEQLTDFQVEWLGVPDRLEQQLVPQQYPLHTIAVEGFQKKGLDVLRVLLKFPLSIWQARQLLKRGNFHAVLTTGGYIAAPAVIAARWLGLPVVLHESNALPGKVTRFLSPWCTQVAIGFPETAKRLPRARTRWVGTPVRSQFQAQTEQALELPIPSGVPLVIVVGGSQGAVGVNRLVRQAAPAWLDAGIWVVHLTGDNDPESATLHHEHYLAMPFYHNMAGLFHRADLAISRAGAGTLTELAMTGTPSILIPYPYAAEDHQTYNARAFADSGAALLVQQAELTAQQLSDRVLQLLDPTNGSALAQMAQQADRLAVKDSADQMAVLLRQLVGV